VKANYVTIPTKFEWCWHKWDEFCDVCGTKVKGHEWQSNKEPDFTEKDYCINCLHELIKTKK
jgi:hypothetical protein